MIYNLSEDIIYIICKKFHRFIYLYNLVLVNKEFNKICNDTLEYHYTNMDKYLNSTNTDFTYKYISQNLFYSKILNTKKINNIYYNTIKNYKLSDLIKLLIIFNQYNHNNSDIDYIKIINKKELELFLSQSNNDTSDTPYYFPFIIMYLQHKFIIFIEYSNKTNTYRLKLKYNNTDVSIYKSIKDKTILHMLTLTKTEILQLYL